MPPKARLGRIQYLNVLPIYFALENLFGQNGFHLVRGTPEELNRRMRRGEVDMGSISSMEYGRFPQEYLLLPDLSISSRGPVGSVLLFSRVPFPHLDGRPVRVSAASASGAALLKVLLTELYGVEPSYHRGLLNVGAPAEATAILAIGDEALRLKSSGGLGYELDLGGAWQELTGLPFVFGVWAVRRAFAWEQPETVAALHRLLLRSRSWGLGCLPGLSHIAAAAYGVPPSQILAYLRQLNFSLGPEHEQGLLTFFHYLHDQGELAQAPRLEYFKG